ncbi:response regulator [Serinicoccus kebangsaanensis]|uniref:response regulator n=1 Tax=Serinicoccus kebangsaanensis TaxID=2602069 RepID=UPI00124BEFE7|nr:response regulator transcription factor [Serinicoccus kebangsaanensis]
MIRVLVADDEPLVRAGLSALLSSEPDIDVVATAADGVEAVERARTERPHVACLDIRMPRRDGIAATRELAGPDASPRIPVLVLTTFDTDEHLFGALEAGASGFLLKDAEPDEVIAAIRSVAAGQGTIADGLTRRVIGELVERRRTQPVTASRASDVLTPRETDILLLLAEGLSNEDIARTLVLEVSTVKSHLARMMPKLGVTSRLQAVVWAYQSGVVTVGDTGGGPGPPPKG